MASRARTTIPPLDHPLPVVTLDDLYGSEAQPEAAPAHDPARIVGFAVLAAAVLWSMILLLHSSTLAGILVAVPGMYGLISMWRHSWTGLHFIRATLYLRFAFPRHARRAREGTAGRKVPHIHVVVTSYNIAASHFRAVYAALFRNLADYGVPSVVIASITRDRDRVLLEQVLEGCGVPANIEVVAQFQKGDGKRGALAHALRSVARRHPPPGAVTLLLDGDVVIEDGALAKCLPFFVADPALGALTTNNDAVTDGDMVTRSWYSLRYSQRHVLMSSLSLSERLLVLTGRFSIYRSDEVIRPDFIDIIESDGFSDWLYGPLRFLTGDDKSAWFALLKRRAKMLYIPDVKAIGFEALPQDCNFVTGSTRLLHRWYGNMLRSNVRALRLGPITCGPFTWLCILDQRLSMWTALVGPTLALMLSLTVSPVFLVYYLAWVLVSRLIMSGLQGLAWGRFEPLWPVLLAYDQIWGALLKTFLQFRLNRQSWTRQGIRHGGGTAAIKNFVASGLHVGSLVVLCLAVAWMARPGS
ncbi:glycosyltransferase [Sphingobium sp. B2]|uniref:glycosyltransferase n=1 Tax=Sphingobium sp. B2 TaxID=2583228 RepID=UPI00119FA06E|nr:glycosyltransferase [Sphingobium sp. B2]